MTPRKQLLRHDPENGIQGDCQRAAVASVLDLRVEDVPHFCEDAPDAETYNARVDEYLASRGLCLIRTAFEGNLGLERVLEAQAGMNRGVYFLLMGTSRTGCNHVVVACDGEIVHDPSLTNAGIIGPADDGWFWCEFFGSAIATKPRGIS